MGVTTFENPKVTIDDVVYEAELGKIERTHLGLEDHGIFTSYLYFDFNGSTQGFGGYALDGDWVNAKVVPNYGLEFIKRTIAVLGGYATWENLRGARMYALREKRYGPIVGIMSMDRSRTFFPSELLTDQ